MIVVTGASGQLGRLTIDRLLETVPASEIGASVRDPSKLDDLHRRGVRVREGDFSDPATLTTAFEGASAVLLVSANLLGDECVRLHRAAIEAATAAGVKRILYTGHLGANPASEFTPAVDHAATEEILRESGTAYTFLRNGFYSSTVVTHLQEALATGELRLPADGPVAWTTHADLADATARILIDGGYDGASPPLTGPTAVDFSQVAAIATEITGSPIRRVVISDDEYRDKLIAAGMPAHYATGMAGMFVASRRGDFAPATPDLATLIGRPATPIEHYLRTELAAVKQC